MTDIGDDFYRLAVTMLREAELTETAVRHRLSEPIDSMHGRRGDNAARDVRHHAELIGKRLQHICGSWETLAVAVCFPITRCSLLYVSLLKDTFARLRSVIAALTTLQRRALTNECARQTRRSNFFPSIKRRLG
jgi:hypothetical protein